MDNKKNGIPKLRFPGFTGAWEQRKLGEVATTHARIGWQNLRTSEFLDSGYYMLITGTDFKNGAIDFSNIHYVEKERYDQDKNIQLKGENILVTKDGTLGKVAYIDKLPKPATLNAGVFNIKVVDKTVVYPQYLFQYLKAPFLLKFASEQSTGGTIKHLNQGVLVKFPIPLPSIGEQEKIVKFLNHVDSLIALHQRKLEHLQEQKKGLLQKMFPKNGETVPEVRFPGFTDAWEQRKLSSMTQYKNGKGHEDKQTDSGDFELVNLNSISIDGGFKHSGKFINESDDGILYKNDLVMILSDVGHGDLLGRVALIPDDNKFILNQRVALLRPNKTVNPEFLFFYINSHQKYFKSQGAGMSQLNISKKSVETFSSLVPNIDEQKKISLFLMKLDSLITLHQRKLDHLELMKKGLLQQMFV
ncbi:restriction endonuclease subunit S [Ligilactobacillus salivarius]|uniref:restriction endonuclease subunit S n=1 Tax=Ligilactobacillus salivarius TaxID=1624 RepID=UPI0015BB0F52|nr:restriction endonuclease subunit S [Ligilactobacillus salivarius]MBD5790641.1 restriction endonuclease subunit S [Ligilactobacillus salivarius]